MVGLLALALIVAAAVVWGRKGRAGANQQKRELLRPLEGQYVTLETGTRFVVPRTGRVLATEDPFAVTFDDGGARAVPLDDIRWIDGPEGDRLGGPW